jgi:hypothetical protein
MSELKDESSRVSMKDMFKEESVTNGGGISSCVTSKTVPLLSDKKPIEWYLKYDEDKFIGFEQIERTSTIYKCDDNFDKLYEYRVIEPLGMGPALILIDHT